jgi:hypothetical protein
MQVITQSEAQEALDAISDGHTKFSVQGKPDRLCNVAVFNVRVWDGEDVDWKDVMFVRKEGKVKVYAGQN